MNRGAIILCGGKSTRMGSDKASLPFGEEQMLQRVARLVSQVVEPENIVCVAADGQQLPVLAREIRVVCDRFSGRGPMEGLSNLEAECYYLDHCLQFPGAVQVHLGVGDFMIYRNLAWHTGLYLPYRPRATIHDIVSHLEGDKITEVWRRAQKKARAALEKTREQP